MGRRVEEVGESTVCDGNAGDSSGDDGVGSGTDRDVGRSSDYSNDDMQWLMVLKIK